MGSLVWGVESITLFDYVAAELDTSWPEVKAWEIVGGMLSFRFALLQFVRFRIGVGLGTAPNSVFMSLDDLQYLNRGSAYDLRAFCTQIGQASCN